MPDKTSRKDLSHERILDVAARAIRRSGYDGVGVASIMKEAGLTHGGFYAHFASRNALLSEAMLRASTDSAARIRARIALKSAQGASPLRALVESYLSEEHFNAAESGCPLAALASEIPRQCPQVRAAAGDRVLGLINLVRQTLPSGEGVDSAQVIASTMIGAMQLARALGGDAGKALLAANRAALVSQYDHPG